MPPLFRRKPADLVEDVAAEVTAEEAPPVARPRAHTPSKKELGKETPKRGGAQRRRAAEPPPANRREAYRRMRQRQREQRAEVNAGMRAGDDRYLMARDKGAERALVRDIVDSRRTVGSWFLGGALVVLIGSSAAMPPIVRFGSNLLWAALAIAVVIDSILIARKVKRLIRERFPHSTQRPRSLYFYAISRALAFRRMRIPNPRVNIGDPV